MKRAIGAIAVYNDPEKGRTALLQVRGKNDSFPDCVEKTWGGGAEDGEKLSAAVCREYREEIAECFGRASVITGAPNSLTALQKENVTEDPEQATGILDVGNGYVLERINVLRIEGKKLIVTLLCEIGDESLAQAIEPLIEAGVIMKLSIKDIGRLVPISAEHKTKGLSESERNEGKLGMFPDEIEAVKRALQRN